MTKAEKLIFRGLSIPEQGMYGSLIENDVGQGERIWKNKTQVKENLISIGEL